MYAHWRRAGGRCQRPSALCTRVPRQLLAIWRTPGGDEALPSHEGPPRKLGVGALSCVEPSGLCLTEVLIGIPLFRLQCESGACAPAFPSRSRGPSAADLKRSPGTVTPRRNTLGGRRSSSRGPTVLAAMDHAPDRQVEDLRLALAGTVHGCHATRARHRAVDSHRPEPAKIFGTIARLVNASDNPFAAVDSVVVARMGEPRGHQDVCSGGLALGPFSSRLQSSGVRGAEASINVCGGLSRLRLQIPSRQHPNPSA